MRNVGTAGTEGNILLASFAALTGRIWKGVGSNSDCLVFFVILVRVCGQAYSVFPEISLIIL